MTTDKKHQGPLFGLNVLDFGWYYAGPMAGMLLADQGANVIRVVKPGAREVPEQQYRLLNRNKKLLELDLKTEAGKAQALQLIKKADILIENFRPGVMKRLGLDYATIKPINPGLVYLSLPGFASNDIARRHTQAWEGVVGAACCAFTRIHQTRTALGFPPVYTSVPICSTQAAMHGAIAIMAALSLREKTNCGTLIEAPLVEAGLFGFGAHGIVNLFGPASGDRKPQQASLPETLACLAYSSTDSQATANEKLEAARDTLFSAAPFYGKIYSSKDDKKIIVCLPGHVVLIDRLLHALNINEQVKDLGLINKGPWHNDGQGTNLSHREVMQPALVEHLTSLIRDAMAQKTAQEMETLFLEERIPASVIRTHEDWLKLDPMLKSGVLTTMAKGASSLTVPGPAASLDNTEGTTAVATPEETKVIGVNDATKLFGQDKGYSPQTVDIKKGDLLKDIQIVDFSNILAGPTSSHVLAQYGARIIKLDPPSTEGMNHTPYLASSLISLSQGKESLLLNLKTLEGQGALERLMKQTDIVVHNCLDETAEKLGISAGKIHQTSPSTIVCQLSAYGGPERGWWENRPGFDWQAQSSSGMMAHYGSSEFPFLHGMAVSADVMGGLCLAFTSLVGLYQRHKTGYAAEGRTSLVRAVNYSQLPWMALDNSSLDWRTCSSSQAAKGDSWHQQLYQCKDDWIFVGASAKNTETLTAIIQAQAANQDQTREQIFQAYPATHWQALFDKADIGCHRVMYGQDMLTPDLIRPVPNTEADETASGRLDILSWTDHPCGSVVNMKALNHVTVGEGYSWKRLNPAPRLGQDSRKILAEIGYSEAQISLLVQQGVVHDYLPALGDENTQLPVKKAS